MIFLRVEKDKHNAIYDIMIEKSEDEISAQRAKIEEFQEQIAKKEVETQQIYEEIIKKHGVLKDIPNINAPTIEFDYWKNNSKPTPLLKTFWLANKIEYDNELYISKFGVKSLNELVDFTSTQDKPSLTWLLQQDNSAELLHAMLLGDTSGAEQIL